MEGQDQERQVKPIDIDKIQEIIKEDKIRKTAELLKIPVKVGARCEVTIGRRTWNLIFKDFNQNTYAFLFEDDDGNQYLIPYKSIKMLKVYKQ